MSPRGERDCTANPGYHIARWHASRKPGIDAKVASAGNDCFEIAQAIRVSRLRASVSSTDVSNGLSPRGTGVAAPPRPGMEMNCGPRHRPRPAPPGAPRDQSGPGGSPGNHRLRRPWRRHQRPVPGRCGPRNGGGSGPVTATRSGPGGLEPGRVRTAADSASRGASGQLLGSAVRLLAGGAPRMIWAPAFSFPIVRRVTHRLPRPIQRQHPKHLPLHLQRLVRRS